MDPVVVPVDVLIAANEAYQKGQKESEFPIHSEPNHLYALGYAIHAALAKQAELGNITVLR
jgi:hypothetical protein